MTLPPIKNVDAEQLARLRRRAPLASTALIVRAGLQALDKLDDAKLLKVLNEQKDIEQKQPA